MNSEPTMMTQFDAFLSHSSIDKPWVIKLKDDLLRYGVSVWLDRDEIRPGDLFAKALEQGLANSRAVALIVSPEAMASGWVEAEYYRALSLAQQRQTPLQLIPVILREAQLPGFLQDRSWVDFRDETAYAENVWRLVWGITGQRPFRVLKRAINPFYYPGPVPPEKFIGHQKAVEFCRARLTAQRPTNIAITGERRIGKTSLLHYLQAFGSQADWGQHLCLWLDPGILGVTLEPTTFWREVLQLLKESLTPTSFIEARITNLQSQPVLATGDIESFLKYYRQNYRARTIILMLDEFEQIFASYNPLIQDLLNGLRVLTLAPDSTLTLITASRNPLSQVCQRFTQESGLEFHSNFAFYPLERFDQDEMVQVIQKLLAGTNVEFNQQELDYIWQVSQGPSNGAQPVLMQAAASLIFDQKQSNQNLIDYRYLDRQFKKLTKLIWSMSLNPPLPPSPPLDIAAIYELLKAIFNNEELTIFCFDHFRPVYEQFSPGMDRQLKIHFLIEHCDRYKEFDKLLALVKKISPKQCAKFNLL